ncbi:MAG TPA: sugar phosphate isomerase/epimerase, partial [Planctomycetota bacterium]|nr:sugar phosphate isomerase/epimerase [Planctomycetota bacterium]
MKIGVFTVLFGQKPLDEILDGFCQMGVEAVELGVGNYPGASHVPVKELLNSVSARSEFLAKIKGRGLEVSALSCHGNPLHPDKKLAKQHHDTWRDALRLAKLLKVETVICFSGCPGDSDRSLYPNWVTCPWPEDFAKVLDWQWTKKALPYWKAEAKQAAAAGVRVAFEMHPGFLVYNPETMLRLRESCGPQLGCNLDPSHLFWQGIDPVAAVRALSGCIYHVHAKDTLIDPANTAVNGVLDTKHYGAVAKRSWVFRTVGYGHSMEFWRNFLSALRVAGYDGVLSIEHEDSLMSTSEGFAKAFDFLKKAVIRE